MWAYTKEMSFLADLDGESFLVLSEVGFWLGVLRRNMPRANIVGQADRSVFEQLVRSTDLASFVTDVTHESRSGLDCVAAPIAHATFCLSTFADAPQRVRDIDEWASRPLY